MYTFWNFWIFFQYWVLIASTMHSLSHCFDGYFLKLLNISHAWRLSASTMQSPCLDGYFLKLFDTFQCCVLIASTMQSLALIYTFCNFWTFFSILSTNCLNHAIMLWCILFETFEYFFNTEYWLPQPCNHILNETLFEYTSDCLLVVPYAALPRDCAIRWLVVW